MLACVQAHAAGLSVPDAQPQPTCLPQDMTDLNGSVVSLEMGRAGRRCEVRHTGCGKPE